MSETPSKARLGRILITGGAGFVGCSLIARLTSLNLADHVRVLDNEVLGSRAAVEPYGVEFLKGDIRDKDDLRRALDGIDAVVHLAADTRVIESIENPEFNFENNVVGTFRLLMEMKRQGISRIVSASTGGAIIGEREPPVHEAMVPHPAAPYGASKLALEGYQSAFAGAYGFKTMALRFSNVYGPLSYHKGSVVATFCRRVLAGKPLMIYGDGEQTRDYVYSDDLCDGIIAALRVAKPGIFQLGTGRPTSINELIAILRDVVGPDRRVEVEYHDFRGGELRHTYCDISKARNELGYDPTTPLHEGLARTWAWFAAR